MPFKDCSREQDWLLPPSLGELIPADHPVRFVAEFVDTLPWAEVGMEHEAEPYGAPAYAPQVLLAAWLYGFMVRIRTTRKLERACRESVPLMWLTGMQRPDHSTLARFYQRNRQVMRSLFKQTVRLAMEVGLVEFALQAVDGTRLGSAARASLNSREATVKLLEQVESELVAMEAANQREDEADPPGPRARLGREQVREHLKQALAEMDRRAALPGGRNDVDAVSASDPEAALIKAPRGYVVGYNAQAAVDSKAQIVVAADVTACSSDGEQLLPMLAEARAMTGRDAEAAAADSGYFDIAAILEAEQTGRAVFVPQPRRRKKGQADDAEAYAKAHFAFDPLTDTYRCPEGKLLPFAWLEHSHHGKPAEVRVYHGRECQGCPAQASGVCTRSAAGRQVKRYAHDGSLPPYLERLQSERGRQMTHQRSAVVEPLFASTKERLGMLRFLLRGLLNVKAEWHLTCAVHNLLKLWRHWWQPGRKSIACPG